MEELLIIPVILIVWYLFIYYQGVDGFSGKPTAAEAANRANQMIQYQDTFTQDMYKAREKMPWMDAIIYEEARARLRHGEFTYDGLFKIFH